MPGTAEHLSQMISWSLQQPTEGHAIFSSMLWMSTKSWWEVTQLSQRHIATEGPAGMYAHFGSRACDGKRGPH